MGSGQGLSLFNLLILIMLNGLHLYSAFYPKRFTMPKIHPLMHTFTRPPGAAGVRSLAQGRLGTQLGGAVDPTAILWLQKGSNPSREEVGNLGDASVRDAETGDGIHNQPDSGAIPLAERLDLHARVHQ